MGSVLSRKPSNHHAPSVPLPHSVFKFRTVNKTNCTPHVTPPDSCFFCTHVETDRAHLLHPRPSSLPCFVALSFPPFPLLFSWPLRLTATCITLHYNSSTSCQARRKTSHTCCPLAPLFVHLSFLSLT